MASHSNTYLCQQWLVSTDVHVKFISEGGTCNLLISVVWFYIHVHIHVQEQIVWLQLKKHSVVGWLLFCSAMSHPPTHPLTIQRITHHSLISRYFNNNMHSKISDLCLSLMTCVIISVLRKAISTTCIYSGLH